MRRRLLVKLHNILMAAKAYHTVGPNNNILSHQQCDNQLFAYFWLRFSAISSCKANMVIVFMLLTLSSEKYEFWFPLRGLLPENTLHRCSIILLKRTINSNRLWLCAFVDCGFRLSEWTIFVCVVRRVTVARFTIDYLWWFSRGRCCLVSEPCCQQTLKHSIPYLLQQSSGQTSKPVNPQEILRTWLRGRVYTHYLLLWTHHVTV